MGQLGALIEAYRDRQKYRPKNADLARDLHVARSTVGNWLDGTMPRPAHLRVLSTLLDVPYLRVLDAVLEDAGYLPRAGETGGDTAAKSEAEETSAQDAANDMAARERAESTDSEAPLRGPHSHTQSGASRSTRTQRDGGTAESTTL